MAMVQPIVKWAGGKRQLLSLLDLFIPKEFEQYYEPFAGGAALLFYLQPKRAIMADLNNELINLYQIIRSDVQALINDLHQHQNTKEYYYSVRELDRNYEEYAKLTAVQRASRLLYLNRTCYNGLYRVNRRGEFNTPYGHYKNPGIVNAEALIAMHRYFKENEITFLHRNFVDFFQEQTFKKGDFVYLDPPYDCIGDQNNFVYYNAQGFGKSEQLQLKEICDKLTEQGVKFLLSNSATPFILDLYRYYYIDIVKARRIIASQVDRRGAIDEVVIRNYVE
ncbi:DNA adenine methylase [Entomospira nematocerorum]|uniref:Site-specific DNA-methyltransferase (adenine-specific) n=1 Tax=Entomospira nematocerorum TaxID=2719987 RepID=A0A968GFT0_9SPIO|nr:DNA adenine methylase [Entomospira nematocera]NIZ46371.1 DNA adenine methylase [Entomospira nematocera]WDI33824.1 DNA adenine methylase [Entomospira nematocera]